MGAQAQHAGQYVLEGPDLDQKPKPPEVLTLAVHELATNALKYGALSVPSGKVWVNWSTYELPEVIWLSFDWLEEGAPPLQTPDPSSPRRGGFGIELIEGRTPYELKGRGSLTIAPGGAHCQAGASFLETAAPQRATVFGDSWT